MCAGTNIVAHEFFHAIHGVALKSMAPHIFTAIERAALRAVEEGIYQHHPVTTHIHTRTNTQHAPTQIGKGQYYVTAL